MRDKIKILDDCCHYTDLQLKQICEISHNEIELIYHVKSKEQLSLLTSLNANKNIRIISNYEYSRIVKDTYNLDFSFNDILQKIVRDENLPLLYDRYFPKNRFGYKLKKSLLLYYAEVTSEAAKVFLF